MRRPRGMDDKGLIEWMLQHTIDMPAPYGLTRPCRIWTLGTTVRGTRPCIRYKGRAEIASRLLWQLQHPGEMCEEVQHHCDRGLCIEPTHLSGGTRSANNRAAVERGFNPRVRKTHCPRGHAYAGANLRTYPHLRRRWCRACERIRSSQYKQRQRVASRTTETR